MEKELDTNIEEYIDSLETTEKCPHCGNEVPASKFCVACGCPMETEDSESDAPASGLQFDLTPLNEIQTEGGIFTSDAQSSIPIEEMKGIKDTTIENIAKELLNSAHLELWSIGILRQEETNEDLFMSNFESYHHRLERCIEQRDHLLSQARDLEELVRGASEARVKLDELEERKSLNDLHEGEYEVMAPALRWTIDFHESELDLRRETIAKLESPLELMPSAKVDKLGDLVDEAMKLVSVAESSERLRPKTADMIRASIDKIEEIMAGKAYSQAL